MGASQVWEVHMLISILPKYAVTSLGSRFFVLWGVMKRWSGQERVRQRAIVGALQREQ
jgi:hypothetical protein